MWRSKALTSPSTIDIDGSRPTIFSEGGPLWGRLFFAVVPITGKGFISLPLQGVQASLNFQASHVPLNLFVCPLEATCRPNRGQRIHRPSVPIQPLAPFEKTRTMHHPTFHAFKSLTAQTLLSGILTLTCQAAEGFTDTPMQPNGKWHVHDPNRPKPPVVTPGEHFSHQAPAPSDAVILFDGTDYP